MAENMTGSAGTMRAAAPMITIAVFLLYLESLNRNEQLKALLK
jgi:hypothetical protein